MIEPISEAQQRQVIRATDRLVRRASERYDWPMTTPQVDFDLRGKTAGMYQIHGRRRRIRYNPWVFAKHYEDSLNDTVPHEVAHFVVDCMFGFHRVKPHGPEWQGVMRDFGVEPRATGQYDLEGVPVKQYRTFEYHCGCRSHQLTMIRHRRIQDRRARYLCNTCGNYLVAMSQAG